ncbi:MAG: T9SS type A sorting domain-containing protein [Bacteroidota bacterium]
MRFHPAFRWILLLLLFSPVQQTTAQLAIDWIPLNDGLEGDQVDLLWQSPAGTFFAGGAYSGLFRSPAYRAPWEMTSLRSVHARKITGDQQGNIYVAGYEGLFVSSDEGLTWQTTNLTDPVFDLAVLPNGSVFAGTYDGLYRRQSSDTQFSLLKQWHPKRHINGGYGKSAEPISQMTVLENGTLVVAAASNLYYSQDGNSWECLSLDSGETCWERLYENGIGGIARAQITSLDSFENTVLIGDYGAIMTYCPSSAYSFDPQKPPSDIPVLGNQYIDSAASEKAFYQVMELCSIQGFGGGFHLFSRTRMPTASWETMHEESYAVEVDQEDGWVCIGKNNGVHCSDNDGTSWVPWNEGLSNAQVRSLLLTENNLLFASTMHGMYFDTQKPTGWTPVILNQTNGYSARNCISSPYAFLQASESSLLAIGGGFYYADDPADMWERAGTSSATTIFTDFPDPFDFPFCGTTFNYWVNTSNPHKYNASPRSTFVRDEVFMYRKSFGKVHRSIDGFVSSESFDLPARNSKSGLFTASGQALYYYQDNQLWQSQNRGDTWQEVSFPDAPITVLDFNVFADTLYIAGTTAGLYISQNAGQSWQDPIASDQAFHLLETNRHGIIIAGDKLISTDNGVSWQIIETPLPGYVNDIVFDEAGIAYAATDGWGVFKSASPLQSTTPVATLSKPLETGIFPNPAQSAFKISLELSELAVVEVELYDVLGRHLGQLFNRQLSRGVHYLPFARKDRSAGIYLVQIKAGDQVTYETVIFR